MPCYLNIKIIQNLVKHERKILLQKKADFNKQMNNYAHWKNLGSLEKLFTKSDQFFNDISKHIYG